jgi:hypothetical protein
MPRLDGEAQYFAISKAVNCGHSTIPASFSFASSLGADDAKEEDHNWQA